MPPPTPAELQAEIASLKDAVTALQTGLSTGPLPTAVAGLNTAVQKLQNAANAEPWFTNPQHGSVSTQLVGNGSLQAVSPSFTGLGLGGNLASLTYTALKVDETGIYFLGKKVGNDPLKTTVDDLAKKFVAELETPGAGLLEKIALANGEISEAKSEISGLTSEISAVKGKLGALGPQTVAHYLAALSSQIRAIKNRPAASRDALKGEERTLRDIQANRDAGRIKGAPYEYNKAQIDSLERSIKLLAEAIGI